MPCRLETILQPIGFLLYARESQDTTFFQGTDFRIVFLLAFNPVHNRRTFEPGSESRWSKEVVTLFKNAATHEISNPFRAYLQQRRHFRNSEVFVHHSLVPVTARPPLASGCCSRLALRRSGLRCRSPGFLLYGPSLSFCCLWL